MIDQFFLSSLYEKIYKISKTFSMERVLLKDTGCSQKLRKSQWQALSEARKKKKTFSQSDKHCRELSAGILILG